MKSFIAYSIKVETNGQYEICLECFHISIAINKKKYSKVKNEKIYCVDVLDYHYDKYVYERVYIKYRHAKKAYNKLKMMFYKNKKKHRR
ncbi:MAG: hypothetical protein K0B07_05770 [DPANN group archaeon]|nr:hypothetical protein [DPANN group archaeon]